MLFNHEFHYSYALLARLRLRLLRRAFSEARRSFNLCVDSCWKAAASLRALARAAAFLCALRRFRCKVSGVTRRWILGALSTVTSLPALLVYLVLRRIMLTALTTSSPRSSSKNLRIRDARFGPSRRGRTEASSVKPQISLSPIFTPM